MRSVLKKNYIGILLFLERKLESALDETGTLQEMDECDNLQKKINHVLFVESVIILAKYLGG